MRLVVDALLLVVPLAFIASTAWALAQVWMAPGPEAQLRDLASQILDTASSQHTFEAASTARQRPSPRTTQKQALRQSFRRFSAAQSNREKRRRQLCAPADETVATHSVGTVAAHTEGAQPLNEEERNLLAPSAERSDTFTWVAAVRDLAPNSTAAAAREWRGGDPSRATPLHSHADQLPHEKAVPSAETTTAGLVATDVHVPMGSPCRGGNEGGGNDAGGTAASLRVDTNASNTSARSNTGAVATEEQAPPETEQGSSSPHAIMLAALRRALLRDMSRVLDLFRRCAQPLCAQARCDVWSNTLSSTLSGPARLLRLARSLSRALCLSPVSEPCV